MASMCEYEILLYRCQADGWEQQKECKYAIKSPGRNECLYHCRDNRCDSVSAQISLEKERDDNL